MKRTSQFAIVVGLVIGLDGCFLGFDPCPGDQKLGDLQLTNPDFSPYRGNETLNFVTKAGEQMSLTNFESALLSTRQQLIISTPCYKSDFVKQRIYYDVPRLSVSYRKNKNDYLNTLHYSFGIQDLRTDQTSSDTLFAEDLTISNTFNQPSAQFRVLVSDRGNRARFDPVKSQYPRLIQYRIIQDTLLNGRSYKQVYCAKESPTVYFTTREGIVLFKDKQQWWYRSP